jgi:hypothetical protein
VLEIVNAEKAGVDQRREIELQLLTGDDLPDNQGSA